MSGRALMAQYRIDERIRPARTIMDARRRIVVAVLPVATTGAQVRHMLEWDSVVDRRVAERCDPTGREHSGRHVCGEGRSWRQADASRGRGWRGITSVGSPIEVGAYMLVQGRPSICRWICLV